jgi:uncharacterized protein (DUF58 family)
MHTQIFVDCSASMGKENPQKAAYTMGVAAALGYLSVHNMDKVSFNMVKGARAENPYGTIVGKRAFFRAISDLEKLEFVDESDLNAAIVGAPNTGTNDGLTVIISDFFTDSNWKKAIDYLCYKRRQVLLVQVLSPDEVDPLYSGRVNLIDSESQDLSDPKNMKIKITRNLQMAYEEALNDMIADLKSFCNSRGASFISVKCDEPIEKMLFKELLKVGIMA